MKFIRLLIAILVCLPLVGFSKEMDTTKLDQYMNALDGKFMGSIHVLKDGKMIYHKNLGYTDISTRKKADANTKYRIGSISKTFTATLVFKAVEEKKISLEKTINDYFPTIKNAEKITISHLLNHRSGIHSFTNNEDYLGWHTLQKSEQEMIAIIARGDSKFETGLYSRKGLSKAILNYFS
jgi:D-alanyl-D-alanine carboxypeptidase